MPEHKIIIDTDPGQDDAVAILMALASPTQLEVLGIVSVAGNVGLRQNSINALKVVELSGRTEINVYAGCDKPLERAPISAEHVHGDTGLNGPELPDPQICLEAQHGVDFLIDTLRQEAPKTVTLCTLGPLTNIATALQKAPDIAPRCREIVMMGGGYFQAGNITPAAEFNIYVDPQAADLVFKSGIPITMASLDVTHQALTTNERLEALFAVGTKSARAVGEMLRFSQSFDLKKYGWTGAPLHDPCVIAYLLKPALFQGKMCHVAIETQSELTMGATVVDFWHITDQPRTVNFLYAIEADGFYELICERLGRLNHRAE